MYLSFLVDMELHMLRPDTFVRKDYTVAGVSASMIRGVNEC